ncbi:hypothetical protein PV327_004250 [Microctonus hyperodae]|uniref:Uncharacterized protein n=1 Tax=Microctonus hyperodae TaxID=165561 RepID=A0AA39FBZ7_MICHY|nr:hypothetical protein PV327_004250 [Microctonus hyperodae]
MATMGRQDSSSPYQGVPDRPLQSQPTAGPPPNQPPVPGAPPPGGQIVGGTSGDLSLNLRPGSRTTSAPSSPAKTRESLLQRVQSLTGAAREQVHQLQTSLHQARLSIETNPAKHSSLNSVFEFRKAVYHQIDMFKLFVTVVSSRLRWIKIIQLQNIEDIIKVLEQFNI